MTATTAADIQPAAMMLPAQALARAWHDVFLAASDDDEHPTLYKAVRFEWFNIRGVRLLATDSYVLFSAWVPTGDYPEPGLDEKPDHEVTLLDADGNGAVFFRHVLKLCAKDGGPEEQHREILARPGTMDVDPKRPTLGDAFTRGAVTFSTEDLRVQLPAQDAGVPWVPWRAVWVKDTDHGPVGEHAFTADLFGRFAKMKGTDGTVTLRYTAPNGRIGFTCLGWPGISGVVMPRRVEDDQPQDDPDTPRFEVVTGGGSDGEQDGGAS